ncbi:MAG TPA: hypothetical protein PLP23_20690 [Panacibacter sp.]|nr:hypothetical protein [Panacibacter sp.]
MKKQILTIALGLTAILFSTATFATVKNVNNNPADEKNNTSFKIVADQVKSETNSSYTVRSQVNGNDVISAYDKNGKWIYSIEYLDANNLEKGIIDIVKDGYNKYYISGMEKVTQPGFNEVYVVHIEDAVSVKTIRVSGGESELVEDFTKG